MVEPNEEPGLVPVKDFLPDAPVADDVVVPENWVLGSRGVGKLIRTREGLQAIPIASAPIVIAGRLINLADGTENIRLACQRDGCWKLHTVERAVIASTRTITGLANLGFPITSRNASHVVDYLADFEAVNLPALPRAQVSQQMGWHQLNGEMGFLWGRALILSGMDMPPVDLALLSPEHWQKNLIAFQGADGGDEQIADAFVAAGSLEGWLRGAGLVANFPKALLALYGSLTPPVLEILRCPNFIMDWCGRTSVGKTTTIRGGGSCWGNPDERAPASVLGTWDATRVWINRASVVLHNLPLILDDTKRCNNPKDIARVLYDVASGQDRRRGSLKGTRRTGTWNTVLLSTGEAPATSFTQDGGTRARVLTIWGNPFEQANQDTAPLVQQINREFMENYGHAGPEFVKFLLAKQAEWEGWRRKYHDIQADYQERAGDNPVAGRLCAYFAALDLVANLAHAALDLPWPYRDPIDAVWEDLLYGVDEADVAAQSLVTLLSWARSNQSQFFGHHQLDRPPVQGWAGKWDKHGWAFIGFLPHLLTELLVEFGFDSEAIIRTWQDRNWLETTPGRRTKQVRLDREQTYVYAIRRSAIDEVENASFDDDDDPPMT